MKASLRPQNVALAALACGVAATLFAWYMAGRQAEAEVRAQLSQRASLASSFLERRLLRYIDMLYGLQGLVYHDVDVSRLQFARYAKGLDLEHRFPDVRSIGFVRRVPDSARERFVAEVRNDRSLEPAGYPDFDIRPPGRRDEYWVVDYSEPARAAAMGLDVLARDGAAEAAKRARDFDEPAATGRYRLVREQGTGYGLVLYLPVYGPEGARTLAERRASLRGFVSIVLRIDDMLADLRTGPAASGLRLMIHDAGRADEPPAEDAPLFTTARPALASELPAWAQWRRVDIREIPVAGRVWHLHAEDDPALNPWLRLFPLVVLAGGLSVSLLLFAVLYAIARTRAEAIAMATRATRDLRAQLSFTHQLIEAMPNPVFYKDVSGRYLGCNRAFERFAGMPRESIVGKTTVDVVPSDQAERSIIIDKAILEKPAPQSYEASMVDPVDGSRHDMLVNKAPFFDPGGELAGLVGVLVDITERKRLEADTRAVGERVRAVIQAAPLAIVARDLNRVIGMWNPAAERVFGWKESEVLNTDISIVPDHLRAETTRQRLRAEAGETIWIEETQRKHKDGHLVDVSMSIAPIHDAEGRVTGTMITVADISARKHAEAALRESEARLRLAMDAAQMGMWYWECEGDTFTYSDGFGVLFGRAPEAPRVHYRELQKSLHADDRELFQATLRHAVKQGADFHFDYRVVWPDGAVHWVSNRAQVYRGDDGRARRIVGVAMDITERKIAEQRIAHMAHHDALTGLPNRVLLRDRIQQAIAQAHRSSRQLAVLFVDLDRFKTINDSLGHQFGDRLLQAVASRILVCVREGDTVSRVGGDEFVIVVPGIEGSADASSVAAKILEVLGAAFHLHGNDYHVAASIGISLYPADGSDAETLMRNADTAMYHAKDSGRGNFQFFTQHMNVAAQQRLTLETALRRALENHEFELSYQPLFDLRDRSITGFEALVRWHPPGGEVLPPGEFVAAAEDSGLIIPIGEWVLREALRQARTWQAPGRPMSISVNVSANQLARSNFVERLRAAIDETGIEPARIELEVTESVIIEGAGEARAALDQVAALGVGVAIDDFGTGYSGLAYLKRLPIDTVKIDQSFVRDLTLDADDAAIVTAIVAMARSLGVDVIAEGIETEEQLAELKRLGCRRGQGYLLARPMSAAAVAKLLARSAPNLVSDTVSGS